MYFSFYYICILALEHEAWAQSVFPHRAQANVFQSEAEETSFQKKKLQWYFKKF